MSKFIVFTGSNSQYYFNLKASNGETILRSSEGYTIKQNCYNGISSVRTNSQFDFRFEKFSSFGQYYFRLKAANGEIIGVSEGYVSSYGRDSGIASVKINAPDAPVSDLT